MIPTPKSSSTRLQLPVGLSGSEPVTAPVGSIAFATDTDLVRVRISSGWSNLSGGGGGGSITSISAGAGIIVTNPTGPVVTVAVDFTTVASVSSVAAVDANALHRTANDWASFPAVTPAASNKVLLETPAKATTTIDEIKSFVASSIPVVAYPNAANPYLATPASPSPYDDEFDAGSADLAARGWTFVNRAAPSVAMIRDGDILPNYAFTTSPAINTNTIPAGHYRSTIIGSVLFLQLPPTLNAEYIAYKTVTAPSATWPNGSIAWLRGNRFGLGSAGSFTGLLASGLAYTAAGLLDDANRVYTYCDNDGAASGQNNEAITGRNIAGASSTVANVLEQGHRGGYYDIVGNVVYANVSGSTANTRQIPLFVDTAALSGLNILAGNTYSLNPTLFNKMAMHFVGGAVSNTIMSAPGVPYAYAIDFCRFYNGDITNKWIADPGVSMVGGGGGGSITSITAGAGILITAPTGPIVTVTANLSSTTPPAIAAAGSVGISSLEAREDHTHAHGTQAGGTTHANANSTTAGFLPATPTAVLTFLATPSSANLASAVTDETGTAGSLVFSNSPTFVTPALGTPSSGNLANCTGFPASGLSGTISDAQHGNRAGGTLHANANATTAGFLPATPTAVLTFLATPSSANLSAAVTDETGSGALVFATSPTLVTPALGTPASGNLANCTGFPAAQITGTISDAQHGNRGGGALHANVNNTTAGFLPATPTAVLTWLANPTSANLGLAVPDETGAGALVFAGSPTLVSPTLGTVASGNLVNCTGYNGAVGGDLSGTVLSTNVVAIHETSGPTKLTIGAIADNQLLIRSGTTIVGTFPSDGPFVTGTSGTVMAVGTVTVVNLNTIGTPGSIQFPIPSADGVVVSLLLYSPSPAGIGANTIQLTNVSGTASIQDPQNLNFNNLTITGINNIGYLSWRWSATANQWTIVQGYGYSDVTGVRDTLAASPSGVISQRITFVNDPVGTLDAANKRYVDNRGSSPYLQARAPGDAFDDEFDSGSADLATRGWTIKNNSGTTLTRVGEVIPAGATLMGMTALTSSQYRSTLANGCLWLQLPATNGIDFYIYKTISVPTTTTTSGACLWGRVVPYDIGISGVIDQPTIGVFMSRASAGNVDTTNRIQTTRNLKTGAGTSPFEITSWRSQAGSVTTSSIVSATPYDAMAVMVVNNATPKFWPFAICTQSLQALDMGQINLTTTGGTSGITLAGIQIFTNATPVRMSDGPPMYTIDYMRLKTGDMNGFWPGFGN